MAMLLKGNLLGNDAFCMASHVARNGKPSSEVILKCTESNPRQFGQLGLDQSVGAPTANSSISGNEPRLAKHRTEVASNSGLRKLRVIVSLGDSRAKVTLDLRRRNGCSY